MKYFLFVLGVVLAGCSSPLNGFMHHNAVIPLGEKEVGVFIPEHWEKVSPEKVGTNIVLMARNGAENLVISFENSDTIVTGNALCSGSQTGLSFFEQIFFNDTKCIFQGRPSDNTPLRQFWQKVVRSKNTTEFLLMSCSAEKALISTSQCPEIVDSFEILDKTE